MSGIDIGTVRSPKGHQYRVSWDERSRIVYVKRMGALFSTWTRCSGSARSAREAMAVAEAQVYRD